MEPLVIILDGVLKVIRRGALTSTNSVAALSSDFFIFSSIAAVHDNLWFDGAEQRNRRSNQVTAVIKSGT